MPTLPVPMKLLGNYWEFKQEVDEWFEDRNITYKTRFVSDESNKYMFVVDIRDDNDALEFQLAWF